MIDILEIFKRAKTGPIMKENEFDLLIAKKVAELIKEYDIKFNREEIIPSDNSLVDDIFKAAVDLLLDVGLYVLDTTRIIKFSEEEIKDAVKYAPRELVVGQGKDARILRQRKIEDKTPALIIGGDAGTPLPMELYKPTALSYLREPIIDIIDHAGITQIGDLRIDAGTPLESYATRAELKLLREAANEMGRPGIHLIGGESSTTLHGDMAIMSENYLRPSDAHLIPVLNEMKTNFDNLGRVISGLDYGVINVTLSDPLVGGFARGAEGVAIVHIAEDIIGRVVYHADYHIGHPVHMMIPGTTNRDCLWVISVLGQSLARNTSFISTGNVWPASGAGTETIFYEIVANVLVDAVSGLHPLGVVGVDGKKPNATGLEARFMGEVMHAAVKANLKREDANQLALEYVKRYEGKLKTPDEGKTFEELYDLKTIRPKPFWVELYQAAKKDVENRGIPIE